MSARAEYNLASSQKFFKTLKESSWNTQGKFVKHKQRSEVESKLGGRVYEALASLHSKFTTKVCY